ncbi:hypothetical protein NJB1728e18_37380 [Mycobacterium marinum]|nr:hypothetical protein MMEU_2786 [Mycobacterium marinum str. Europe]GJO27238.1 hypothetical protein NJB1728e18_37380 [Mycobacterium marinum]
MGAAMSPSRAQRAAVRTGDFRRSDQVSLGLIDSLIDTFVAQPHRLVIGVFPA